MVDHMPTDDRIEVAIPSAVAAEFIRGESWKVARLRSIFPLRLGESELGMWRIDGIETGSDGGQPRAFLRRVLVSDPPPHKHSWLNGRCVERDCPDYCYCIQGGSGGHKRAVPRCPDLAATESALAKDADS